MAARPAIAIPADGAYFGRDAERDSRKTRMNWITNYVRPRINSIFSRREMPENLWTKCDECGTMLFHRELSEA
jgi:acetyl-CoA carboxylase carboxyl transferase subunit beta